MMPMQWVYWKEQGSWKEKLAHKLISQAIKYREVIVLIFRVNKSVLERLSKTNIIRFMVCCRTVKPITLVDFKNVFALITLRLVLSALKPCS